MTPTRWPRAPLPRGLFWTLLVCGAVVLVARHETPALSSAPAQAFLGFIVAAIVQVASWLAQAATAAASATMAVLTWLGHGLSWITDRLANVVKATGAMFAKAWDVTRRFWFDVVRPALARVARWVDELRGWLKAKLTPAFQLLSKLRERLRGWYTKFVRPVLDAIETARGILQILAKLHVPFAQALDRYLEHLEAAIAENYITVIGYVNRLTDVLNSIVTFDLLFQRVPFLATLRRDTPLWVRLFWNAQVVGLTPAERAVLAARPYELLDATEHGRQLTQFYSTGSGPLAAKVQELLPIWKAATGR